MKLFYQNLVTSYLYYALKTQFGQVLRFADFSGSLMFFIQIYAICVMNIVNKNLVTYGTQL
jgi:hypothetical protein